MRTLVIQTTIRPDATRAVEFDGLIRGYWRGQKHSHGVLASKFAMRATDDEHGPITVPFPAVVTFAREHAADEGTTISIFDARTGKRKYGPHTVLNAIIEMQIRGVACDITEECRTLVDVRDNPQQADVADEGGI